MSQTRAFEVKLPFVDPVGNLITELSFQSKKESFPHDTGFDYRPAAKHELTKSPHDQSIYSYEKWIDTVVSLKTGEGFNPDQMTDLSLIRAVENGQVSVEQVASVLEFTKSNFPEISDLHRPYLENESLYG